MNLSSSFHTVSNHDRRAEREIEKKLDKQQQQYDPKNSIRELNPYWKDGGSGLPNFKKPTDENIQYKSNKSSSNWRKSDTRGTETDIESINNLQNNVSKETHKEDLNMLASKLLKAELIGNLTLISELKSKLEKAKTEIPSTSKQPEDIMLSVGDTYSASRPLKVKSCSEEGSGPSSKKKKINTHVNNERVRYFADDDKYSLKEMFENEKYESVDEQHKQFLKIASKAKTDLDDFFTTEIGKKDSDEKIDKRNITKAVNEHVKLSKRLDSCNYCLQSNTMQNNLMISMGNTVYLTIPSFEPITEGYCFVVPLRHVPCATQLDENEWYEILEFRKALCKMFESLDKSLIFFETATYLRAYPHMVLHCVPIEKEQIESAPMYFKKAIDESEMEWSTNKKLVSLAGRDVRKAIPKGLPYFSVSFGMKEGYAHVIEDEKMFPQNFAQEIIGGMLDLDHAKWRKPKKLNFDQQSTRVQTFTKSWNKFDCTK